jgi:hypothetical protein
MRRNECAVLVDKEGGVVLVCFDKGTDYESPRSGKGLQTPL